MRPADAEDTFSSLNDMHVENKKLRENVIGYRASFFILLGFTVTWGIILVVNRAPPLHLNSCEALQYYLGALDEETSSLPVEIRRLLDDQAAVCPDDDRGSFGDGNPHH
jgi:hypothetical protein